MYRLRAMPWSDNVSGSKSKQYNAHMNIYIQNLNIPHKKLTQEYFFGALVDDFNTDQWHQAYDCLQEEKILFQIIPHLLPANNPQQSEHASHIGGSGHNNCRRDTTGGSDEQKEMDEGYCALFQTGTPRKLLDTVHAVKTQIRLACYGDKGTLKKMATQSGVKDKISQHWIELMLAEFQVLKKSRLSNRATRDSRLNDTLKPEELSSQLAEISARTDVRAGVHYSSLLEMTGINPHANTPVEILHTWLLGNQKYLWYDTTHKWKAAKESTFAIRLDSSYLGGLTTPPPRANYLVKYKNSLIGKHFKILQQLAVFHLHDLCSDDLLNLWKAAGELGAMLWIHTIENKEEYLEDLQVLIDNLLDVWAKVDPARIMTKEDLGLLCSIQPRSLSAGTPYSAFAASSRIIYPQYPNRDGRLQAYHQQWVVALIYRARRLGWTNEKTLQPGTCKPRPRRGEEVKTAEQLHLSVTLKCLPSQSWSHCQHVVAQSGDICKEGSWVFADHEEEGLPLSSDNVKSVMYSFNVQHDCVAAKCKITQTGPAFIRQERMVTALPKPALVHSASGMYIVNMHTLHNTHLVRRTLPRDLVVLIPLFPDRDRHCKDAAARLRVTGPQKRAEAQRKRRETRERNKAGGTGTLAGGPSTSTIENPEQSSNSSPAVLPVLQEEMADESDDDEDSSLDDED
ncbi:hypothetical protein BKA70DRAFT_1225871 [Coprinopsis sp. MPI-PUGE-AT-0042]|nr:hypothetical protein BKA70DRAFT_1225871 [Coprinopsis sp. MPI-PUGE-AT-0042]